VGMGIKVKREQAMGPAWSFFSTNATAPRFNFAGQCRPRNVPASLRSSHPSNEQLKSLQERLQPVRKKLASLDSLLPLHLVSWCSWPVCADKRACRPFGDSSACWR